VPLQLSLLVLESSSGITRGRGVDSRTEEVEAAENVDNVLVDLLARSLIESKKEILDGVVGVSMVVAVCEVLLVMLVSPDDILGLDGVDCRSDAAMEDSDTDGWWK